ncbi:energy-coupling factor transporter transmembrane protein EcfT [Adlercreutzia sp. ZJ304]|uniref:energy-coupling factor transporter transmembrane component T family protein n=1 Tax=Adlercreutzia sp. ZJ304 TaxID=2709791 RepID=UPI001F14E54E|nr:energy-coupling factor transporter transmembrane protein EcfT [Adlercreutzia sp. ZJ304]
MHRCDARSKIILLLIYSVCLFFIDSWIGMGIAAVALVAVLLASRIPVARVFGIATVVYVLAAFTIVANAFLFEYGSFTFTIDGLIRGCFFAIRILLLVWASLIVCFTSTSTQLTDALNSFLSPLQKLRVPTDDISMVFSIAIRFIPVTAEEYMRIRDAQWSRGAPLNEGSIIGRIKAHMAILIPMFVGLFRRADRLAMAMDARCYGMPGVKRTQLSETKFSPSDGVLTALGGALLIVMAVFL